MNSLAIEQLEDQVAVLGDRCTELTNQLEEYKAANIKLAAQVMELESFIGTIGPCGLAKEDEK